MKVIFCLVCDVVLQVEVEVKGRWNRSSRDRSGGARFGTSLRLGGALDDGTGGVRSVLRELQRRGVAVLVKLPAGRNNRPT